MITVNKTPHPKTPINVKMLSVDTNDKKAIKQHKAEIAHKIPKILFLLQKNTFAKNNIENGKSVVHEIISIGRLTETPA